MDLSGPCDEPAVSGKRLLIPENHNAFKMNGKRKILLEWAIKNGFDTVVLPFTNLDMDIAEAGSFGLALEAGGWNMSFLVPRKLFFLHRDFFRMEGGKRRKMTHFCPTNPDTIAVIKKEAKKIFHAAGKIKVFHLWPDKGEEKTWCSCPTCRAFSSADQNRMTVNATADALAEINPGAILSYYEEHSEDSKIGMRSNTFKINAGEIEVYPDIAGQNLKNQ